MGKFTCAMRLTAPSAIPRSRQNLSAQAQSSGVDLSGSGLHLPEKHVTWRGEAIPGSLLILRSISSTTIRHCWQRAAALFLSAENPVLAGSGLVERSFSYAEDRFNLPRGTIKATLLLKRCPPCSRWMKSFTRCVTNCWSELRSLGLHLQLYQNIENYPDRVLPDRQAVTMDKPFLMLTHAC